MSGFGVPDASESVTWRAFLTSFPAADGDLAASAASNAAKVLDVLSKYAGAP